MSAITSQKKQSVKHQTVMLLFIYLHKLPFACILDYTDKKPWITFQVQLLLTTSAI